MWKAAAVPTTKRVTPSEPMIWLAAAVVHTPPGESCAQTAAGAMTRSTDCGFCGCAAGHICSPYDDGMACKPPALHVRVEVDDDEGVPHIAAQAGQVALKESATMPGAPSINEEPPSPWFWSVG